MQSLRFKDHEIYDSRTVAPALARTLELNMIWGGFESMSCGFSNGFCCYIS